MLILKFWSFKRLLEIFTTDFCMKSISIYIYFNIFIIMRIMFTYVMPCCFISSLKSVINVGIKSLKTFSLFSTCSTVRIMSAWFFGVLTLKLSSTAIVSAPFLQFAKILWYTLKYLSSKNSSKNHFCLSYKSRIYLKTDILCLINLQLTQEAHTFNSISRA